MKDACILNFSDAGINKLVRDKVKSAKGLCWFHLSRARDQRSLQQNAYMWGVVYIAVQAGLEEAWGEKLSIDAVHEFCKNRFLKEPVVNRNTGEVMGETTGSSRELDKAEFSEYIDKITQFAAEYLQTEIPQAGQYLEASHA